MTGDELRQIRRRLGMTQVDLATEIGLDAGTISRTERGKTPISELVEFAVRCLERDRRTGRDA